MYNDLQDVYHTPKILKRCSPKHLSLFQEAYIMMFSARLPSITVWREADAEAPSEPKPLSIVVNLFKM